MLRKISVRDLRPGMYVAGSAAGALFDQRRVYAVEGYVRSMREVLDIARQGYREVFVDLRAGLAASADDCPAEAFPGLDGGPGVVMNNGLEDVRILFGKPRPQAEPCLDEQQLGQALERELDRLPDPPPEAVAASPDDPDGSLLRRNVRQAKVVYAQTLAVARDLFESAARGRPLNLEAAAEVVTAGAEQVEADPGAALWAARLADAAPRLHMHSANVCVLCVAFARHMGLDAEATAHLGLAALVHDLGQTRLPASLTNRRGDLSPQERFLFEKHPEHGAVLLERRGGVPGTVVRAVREHHEREDGKGYPYGLSGGRRSLFGRILALVNRYDEFERPGGVAAMAPPGQGVALLYAQRGSAYRAEDLEHFIRFVGVHPLGSLVRLTDGRAGMVWRHDPARPLSPLVNVGHDERLRPVRPYLVNLADPGANGLHVEGLVHPERLGVLPAGLAPA